MLPLNTGGKMARLVTGLGTDCEKRRGCVSGKCLTLPFMLSRMGRLGRCTLRDYSIMKNNPSNNEQGFRIQISLYVEYMAIGYGY